MNQRQRRSSTRNVASVTTAALAVVALLVLASPVGASTPKSVALRIAQYAVGTADHDNPAHVVTALDVTNAAGISTVNTSNLYVLINLDDVFGYSRLVLFFEAKPFADICLNLPDTIGAAPQLIKCPHQAQGLWDSRVGALSVSNRAIAGAAATGHAVSGADVMAAARKYGITLLHPPTFRAGQGGVVDFATPVEVGLKTKFTVHNCVKLPKTAFGIPVEVAC